MKKTRVGTCGNYDIAHHPGDGQIIRTTVVTAQLEKILGEKNVRSVSYHDWRRHPFSLLWRYTELLFSCGQMILFPDGRSYALLIPLAVLLRPFTRCRVYYNVIGGWLPSHLSRRLLMTWFVRRLDGLFVQTRELQRVLAALRVTKTTVFPNFKPIRVLEEEKLTGRDIKPLRLVFMARVCRLKGVDGLIDTVRKLNAGGVLYTLDIYGQIDPSYHEVFRKQREVFPPYIRYCGVADYQKTSEILAAYFLEVFPTLYDTEGFPGSVLDALCAGLPVLASRWNSFDDVLEEGKTGISFTLGDFNALYDKLLAISRDPGTIEDMRPHCLKKAREFAPEKVISIMIHTLEGDGCR